MTGFGAGRATVQGEDLSVEVRSLNHKYCEVKARLPRELAALEPAVIKMVKENLARGAVDVTVKRQPAGGRPAAVPVADVALAREYLRAMRDLGSGLGIRDDVCLRDIVAQPGVLRLDEPNVDVDSAGLALGPAVDQALTALTVMRKSEGEAIQADLEARLGLVDSVVEEIRQFVPTAVGDHQRRLSERISELARGVAIDPQRLAQEVAFFAERTDVSEELTRLGSHIAQFRALLGSTEPSGRKMDFLVQEMHREVNTTGSKSQHPEISARVVILKAELERIREQVQNVE